MLAKLERRLHQVADSPAVRTDRGITFVGSAVMFRERRLVVESIDVTRRAIHEEEDGVLRFRREVRLFRLEEVRDRVGGGWFVGGKRLLSKESIARKQVDQGQAGKSAADFPEEFA